MQSRGIRIPDDVSITGFDGIPPPPGVPQLSTIRVPYKELGRSAIHQMIRRREEPTVPHRHLVVAGEFIQGATLVPSPIHSTI